MDTKSTETGNRYGETRKNKAIVIIDRVFWHASTNIVGSRLQGYMFCQLKDKAEEENEFYLINSIFNCFINQSVTNSLLCIPLINKKILPIKNNTVFSLFVT